MGSRHVSERSINYTQDLTIALEAYTVAVVEITAR